MKENKTHTVIWIKQDDPTCQVHESPNRFSKQRANELSEMANEKFKSAVHMAIKLGNTNKIIALNEEELDNA